jgi:hypothetical protein
MLSSGDAGPHEDGEENDLIAQGHMSAVKSRGHLVRSENSAGLEDEAFLHASFSLPLSRTYSRTEAKYFCW